MLHKFVTRNSSKVPWMQVAIPRSFPQLICRAVPDYCTMNEKLHTIRVTAEVTWIPNPCHIVPMVVEYGTNCTVICPLMIIVP